MVALSSEYSLEILWIPSGTLPSPEYAQSIPRESPESAQRIPRQFSYNLTYLSPNHPPIPSRFRHIYKVKIPVSQKLTGVLN
jgi:hypothetical protein